MPNLVESVGDTVVNGQNCRMLKSETHVCNSLHDWGKVYFVYEEVGRVYAYNFYKKEFVVWYDFNAEKGDEWALLISYGQVNWDTLHARVDSVDQAVLGGTTRKRMFVTHYRYTGYPSNPIFYYPQRTLIWGIGDLVSQLLTESGFCDGYYAQDLRCFSDTDTGFYQFCRLPLRHGFYAYPYPRNSGCPADDFITQPSYEPPANSIPLPNPQRPTASVRHHRTPPA